MLLGGDLKRKERLSARLGDVLSNLYLASTVLKYYHDQGCPAADLPYVRWCVRKALYECETAFTQFFANMPNRFAAGLLRRIVLPFGKHIRKANDKLDHQLVASMMKDHELRDRISSSVYIGDTDQPMAKMDAAFKAVLAAADADRKLAKATRKGGLQLGEGPKTYEDILRGAQQAGLINEEEAALLREADRLRSEVIQVDAFARGHYAVSAIGAGNRRQDMAA